MIEGGLKKKQRRDKALVDSTSATLILQSYMERLALRRRQEVVGEMPEKAGERN